MPLFVNHAAPESGLNTDNGAMIAWTGWELIQAQQDVDLRDLPDIQGVRKIPLGSFVKDKIQKTKKIYLDNKQIAQVHGAEYIKQ